MALEFSSTDAPIDGVKMLGYGGFGVGKTCLIATLPGLANETIILSEENGLLSLAPQNQVRLYGAARIFPVIKIKSIADLREAYALVSGPQGASLRNVAIDGVSGIARNILESELGSQKDPRKAYGNTELIMGKYIKLFRDLPGKNVYMTATQDREKDGEIQLYRPVMPGKTLMRDLGHHFDVVFAVWVAPKDASGITKIWLRCKPDTQFQAKDRSGALLELEEPNLTNVIAKIKQK